MIVDSVNLARAEGKRVIYDAEHFFDAWRDDPGYALECLRAAVAAGAENMTLCDTNGSSLPGQIAEATAAVVAELGERVEVGIHAHNDLECGVANSLAAVEAGARHGPGDDQRLRRALRQREPGLDPAGAAAEARLRVRAGRSAATADRDRALRRRAHEHDARPRPALRRAQRLRPQGRHARRRRAGRRAHLRAHGPEAGRQQPRRADLRALGQGLGARARRERRDRPRRRRRQARGRADQGARAPRLSLRGGRRLVRPAAAPRGRRVSAAVPARELPRDHREARRRPGRDRGDDQDLGRRAPLRPHRRGQRPGQRARPRAARRDRRAAPAAGRHRAGQLQGPDPRLAPRHRRRHPRAARLRPTAPRFVGLDRRLGEHHRGVLGGAGGFARVRVPDPQPARPGAASAGVGVAERPVERREDPARASRWSASARRSWCSRCCAPAGCRSGRCRSASSATSPTTSGVADAVAVSSGTAALHLGVRALGWGAGDEVVTSPFSFVASANCLLYEGATPVFCDVDPVTLNLDPAAAWDAIGERTAGLLPVDILGYPAAIPELERGRRRGRPRAARGRLRGARRPRLARAPGRLARQPRHASPSTPTSR